MNKMLFPGGGVPLSLDDLQFMQESFMDTIRQISNAMGQQQNFILYGCDILTFTDDKTKVTSINWKAGAVCLNGEIYPVEAGNMPVQDKGTLYWKVVRTEDTDVALKNGTQAKLHSSAKAVLTYTVQDTDEKYTYDSLKDTFLDIIGGVDKNERVAEVSNVQGSLYIYRYQFKGLSLYHFDGTLRRDNTEATLSLPRELGGLMDRCFCTLGKTSEENPEYKMVYAYINGDPQINFFAADKASPKQNLYFTYDIITFG